MRLPFTDHHIQDDIVHKLSGQSCKFSQLLPDGMEHSQFMYHMRKLIKADIVEKQGEHYCLTHRGAQLYTARFQLQDTTRLHRVLIQFVVMRGDDILLIRRKNYIAEKLNTMMLPGGAHFFMASSRTSAVQIAKQRSLQVGDFLCSLETIAPARQYHGLIDIYEAQIDKELVCGDEYEAIWMSLADVAKLTFNQSGSAGYVARQYLDKGKLTQRETYIV